LALLAGYAFPSARTQTTGDSAHMLMRVTSFVITALPWITRAIASTYREVEEEEEASTMIVFACPWRTCRTWAEFCRGARYEAKESSEEAPY
jgi:hypothetical protein